MALILSFVYAVSIEILSIIIRQIEGPIRVEVIIFGLIGLYAFQMNKISESNSPAQLIWNKVIHEYTNALA